MSDTITPSYSQLILFLLCIIHSQHSSIINAIYSLLLTDCFYWLLFSSSLPFCIVFDNYFCIQFLYSYFLYSYCNKVSFIITPIVVHHCSHVSHRRNVGIFKRTTRPRCFNRIIIFIVHFKNTLMSIFCFSFLDD